MYPKLHSTDPIGPASLGYLDFQNCVTALAGCPELPLIFGDLKNPSRPKPLSKVNLDQFSSTEQVKIQLIYSIWQGTPINCSVSDLLQLSPVERETLTSFLLKKD